MRNLKHVGRIDKTNLNVLVAFRTLPGESNMALVIPTAKLSDVYHDAIMKLVESDQAQQSFEFGEILFTRTFPDGRPMLQALRADGHLDKVPTDTITMLPTPHDNVALSQLNVLIAEQRNCTIDELCNFVSGAPKATDATVEEIVEVKDLGRDVGEPAKQAPVQPLQANNNTALSDTDIAKSYRSQADALYKEAALLRKQADELDPPKSKKAAAAKETASA
jgi:hypothetical protein